MGVSDALIETVELSLTGILDLPLLDFHDRSDQAKATGFASAGQEAEQGIGNLT